jgi:hypothetical protein
MFWLFWMDCFRKLEIQGIKLPAFSAKQHLEKNLSGIKKNKIIK